MGESVRILSELQDLSQSQLSKLTGIPQATISAIENDRVNLGVERAKVFSRPLTAIRPYLCFRAGKIRLNAPHNASRNKVAQTRAGGLDRWMAQF